jgi:hypothetical protein
MSRYFSLATLFLLAALTFTGCQNQGGNLYGYDFNSAKITYQISGSSTGSSDVLIKGEKKRIHNQITQTRPNGEVTQIDTILIQNGEKLYTLDPKTKTGSMVKQPFYFELQKLSPEQRRAKLILEAIRDNRTPEEQQKEPPKPEKTVDVAGQKCDLYVAPTLQTCLWQTIPLKAVASLPDYGIQTDTIATKVEINPTISDSEFDVPQDYQITELN